MTAKQYLAKDPAGERNEDDSAAGENKGSWHKILSCPSASESDVVMGNMSYQCNLGMSYCHNFLTDCDWIYNGATVSSTWHRISTIKLPSLHVNYLDGTRITEFDSSSPEFRTCIATAAHYLTDVGLAYFRHGMNNNLSMSDGHVESVSYGKAKIYNGKYSNATYVVTDYYWYPGFNGPGGEDR